VNKLWDSHRAAGTKPTNAAYLIALGDALTDAGVDVDESLALVALAERQQLAYGLKPSDPVPRVPQR